MLLLVLLTLPVMLALMGSRQHLLVHVAVTRPMRLQTATRYHLYQKPSLLAMLAPAGS
jgi:hypothetical protein